MIDFVSAFAKPVWLYIILLFVTSLSCKHRTSSNSTLSTEEGLKIIPITAEPWPESAARDWAALICSDQIETLEQYFKVKI